jgi:hypothetical protein
MKHFTRTARVVVDAVISRIQIPAESLAALEPGDLIDIEPESPNQIVVQLSVAGTIIGSAVVEEKDGRLIATIINTSSHMQGRGNDQWKVRKPKTQTA